MSLICAQGRRRHPLQDQHAGIRRRRQHHGTASMAPRAIRSIPARPAAARREARRWRWRSARCHLPRVPISAAVCGRRRHLRRGRLPPVAGHGAGCGSRRGTVSVQRDGTDGAHVEDAHLLLGAQMRPDKLDPFSSGATRSCPPGSAAPISPGCAWRCRAILAALRSQGHPRGVPARVAPFGTPSARSGALTRLRAGARDVRDPTLRAVRRRTPRARREGSAICSIATSSRTPSGE